MTFLYTASAPGKLYIAGEYAVLHPNHPAILVALNQYITVHATPSQDEGSISSVYSNFVPVPWTRRNGRAYFDERDNPLRYVEEAIHITEDYVSAHDKALKMFDLNIKSDLNNADGRKYGLGSSGAVTVATIEVLLKFYHMPYTKELIYKLSVLTHMAIHSNGSFGDIAASTYGGWLAYSTFDKQWLQDKINNETPIEELLHMKWKDLRIEPLPAPSNLKLVIGWTGSPASTAHLVDQVQQDVEQEQETKFRHIFLQEAKTIVEQLIQAFYQDDAKAIAEGIYDYRCLLQQLSKETGVIIETSTLTKLCDIAAEFNSAAKSSGAGGGDCGIALATSKTDILALEEAWRKHNIQPLEFTVHYEK